MRVVKSARKGGKRKRSNRNERKRYEQTKLNAINKVAHNVSQEMKSIEKKAVETILVEHVGRELTMEDVPLIEKIKTDNGYVLKYDGRMLGEIKRYQHVDANEDMNYKVEFTPFE